MAIRQTRFRPDTCQCEIVYSWDDTLSLATVESSYTLVSIAKGACHSALSDAAAYAAAVTKDNKTKNKIEAALAAAVPAAVTVNANGSTSWKDGVKFSWSFDAARTTLTISITGASYNVATLQSLVNAAGYPITVVVA